MIAYILIATIGLLFVHETLRRSAVAAWACCLVLPLCLTPCWLRSGIYASDFFFWVKLYSVVLIVCWVMALRFILLGSCQWARHAVVVLAAGNIIEAVAKDLGGGDLPHTLNAIAGLLLIPRLFVQPGTIVVDTASPYRDLHWGSMTRGWIVGYSVWNWGFAYLNYPQHAGSSTAALTAALILGCLRPERWPQARVITLGVCFPLMFTFPEFFARYADTSAWRIAEGERLGALVSLTFMLLHSAGSTAWGKLAILRMRSVLDRIS